MTQVLTDSIASAIHVAIYSACKTRVELTVAYKFVDGGKFQTLIKKQKFIGGYRKRSTRMGMLTAVAFSSLCFMLLTSLPFVRARLHSFFRVCHLIGEHGLVDSRLRFSQLGFGCLAAGLAVHMPRTARIAWVRQFKHQAPTDDSIIAAAMYGLDILLRLPKFRYKRAYLTPMPQCSSTQITVPTVTSGWRAGQYVFIRVPALRQVGGMDFLENHPFTIASAAGGQLILVARKQGDWTRALYDLACEESGGEKGEGLECNVLLKGPFVS